MDSLRLRMISTARPATEVDDGWRRSLAGAVRDVETLCRVLGLPESLLPAAVAAAREFPLVVPRSFLSRMRPGDITDPLLRQVLPVGEELVSPANFLNDPVGDYAARRAAGLLHKYQGRALLLAARECAIHCRYCFRRHHAYGDEPATDAEWIPALQELAGDDSIHEIILSGGDPLVLSDRRLGRLVERLSEIPHLRRLRIHSRLPIVLPDRVTHSLVSVLRGGRLTPIMVVHANHPAEVVDDCADALRTLVESGIPTLNQSVLLRGINDTVAILEELSIRLVDLGVLPYYLHQLDRVRGAAHFEVSRAEGEELIRELRHRLPGYAVPRYVAEVAGDPGKRVLA